MSPGFRRPLRALFCSISIVCLLGGCNDDPKPTRESAPAVVSRPVSRAFVGKRITVRGRFSLRGKSGSFVTLGNSQAVYLESEGSFDWSPYSDLEGKIMQVTGTLKFHRGTPPTEEPSPEQHAPDHFYFEMKTTQLQLVETPASRYQPAGS